MKYPMFSDLTAIIAIVLLALLLGLLAGCAILSTPKKQVHMADPGDQQITKDDHVIRHYDQRGNVIAEESSNQLTANMKQPQAPTEGAEFKHKDGDGGLTTMSTGRAADPIIADASKYMNPMLWLGSGMIVIGFLLVGFKQWPPLMWIPKGAAWGAVGGGIVVLVMAVVIESVLLTIIVGVGIAAVVLFVTGGLDNLKSLRKIKELNGATNGTNAAVPATGSGG